MKRVKNKRDWSEMTHGLVPKNRQSMAWHMYRLNRIELERMIKLAAGHCEICREPFPNGRFAIDHCHKTGKVRGLLCRPCNILLGMAKDDTVVLKWAIHYLRRSRGEDDKSRLAQFIAANEKPEPTEKHSTAPE